MPRLLSFFWLVLLAAGTIGVFIPINTCVGNGYEGSDPTGSPSTRRITCSGTCPTGTCGLQTGSYGGVNIKYCSCTTNFPDCCFLYLTTQNPPVFGVSGSCVPTNCATVDGLTCKKGGEGTTDAPWQAVCRP
jgi:hypothetical protein